MEESGWSWAVGSKAFQTITAAMVLIYFIITINGLVLLTGGGSHGAMPSVTWNLQPAQAQMPILNVDLVSQCGVRADPGNACKWARCDWGSLQNQCSCDSLQGEAKNWCNATWVKEHGASGGKAKFTVMGLLVVVVSLAGFALNALQLKGIRGVTPAGALDSSAPLKQQVLHWGRPVIDRIIVAFFCFLFCLIGGGIASGGGFAPAEFTESHRGCFQNDYVSDADQGADCKDVTEYKDFDNALSAWKKYGGSSGPADAMWLSVVLCLVIFGLTAFNIVLLKRAAASGASPLMEESTKADASGSPA
jgi:hypothetical protein